MRFFIWFELYDGSLYLIFLQNIIFDDEKKIFSNISRRCTQEKYKK